MNEKKKKLAFYDTYKSERKEWGNINPVSKIVKDKRKDKSRKACRKRVDF